MRKKMSITRYIPVPDVRTRVIEPVFYDSDRTTGIVKMFAYDIAIRKRSKKFSQDKSKSTTTIPFVSSVDKLILESC